MTRLSVNINKIATLRNSRGGNIPNVLQAAIDCQEFGAQGITVHPRPDQRHIRYQDVRDIRPVITTEFNIEGNPHDKFVRLVLEVRPHQVTLVPDAHSAITSNAGWDTREHREHLKRMVALFRAEGIRTSIFVDANPEMVRYAAETGTDRVELYTEPYATLFPANPDLAVAPFVEAARAAQEVGLTVNAGHDLNLENLRHFVQRIPWVEEVSIGHALISEALYFGLENTIQMYLHRLQP